MFRNVQKLRRNIHNPAQLYRKQKFDILFFGRDNFSCKTLQAVYSASDVWQSIQVVTSDDQKVGRWLSDISISPLKLLSQYLKLPVWLVSPGELAQIPVAIPPPFDSPSPNHLLITASFSQAIPPSILSLFHPPNRLNLHTSLLPSLRGAAPIQRAILKNLRETGVTVVQMEELEKRPGKALEWDSGNIWAQKAVAIPPNSSYRSLEPLLASEGANLLVEHLRRMLSGSPVPIPQDHTQASYARLIKPEMSKINWETWDAWKIDRVHRAIGHQRPIQTFLHPSHSNIHIFAPTQPTPLPPPDLISLPSAGTATFHSPSNALIVRCANDSYVSVPELQTEGRKRLKAKEWWNGIRSEWKEPGWIRFM